MPVQQGSRESQQPEPSKFRRDNIVLLFKKLIGNLPGGVSSLALSPSHAHAHTHCFPLSISWAGSHAKHRTGRTVAFEQQYIVSDAGGSWFALPDTSPSLSNNSCGSGSHPTPHCWIILLALLVPAALQSSKRGGNATFIVYLILPLLQGSVFVYIHLFFLKHIFHYCEFIFKLQCISCSSSLRI